MVANGVGIAVVFTTITRTNLLTCAIRKQEPAKAGAVEQVRSNVGAVAVRPARIAYAVVNVVADLTVAIVT